MQDAGLRRPGLSELFTGFLLLGLTGFGGVLPMARAMMVERRRWLSEAGFTDLLGLCQFLPGGNIINMSVAVGLRFQGARGAVVALLGLILAPSAIVIGLGSLYARFQDHPTLRHLFAGLAAAAAGLLIATAVKIARPIWGRAVPMVIAGLFFLAIAVLRLPLLPTILVLAPLGILATWWAGRRKEAGRAA
ncbi:chromate transporter [Roseomonas sp. KE0001]|uniref:chromate transporter n=1 Tax=Roseomonas sp. KE0001 TaxID=2479201 RepID=UPI0018DF2053|nr:chromate transporter [Roseomonas sp. KE0001]MBI0432931.1 chromate transporter [Roseomonas sp. KE0001]